MAPDTDYRLPPHATDAEQAVLGSLLIDPEAVEVVLPLLRPDDWYHPKHRTIYQAVVALHEQGTAVDFRTVVDALTAAQLSAVGGDTYLASLLTVVPSSIHAAHYAETVRRCAVQRRLIEAAGQIAKLGYQETDVAAALAQAESILFGVTQQTGGRDFVLLRDALAAALEATPVNPTTGEITEVPSGRLPTGFIDLDKLLGGLAAGDLLLLAARPSVGKSAIALAIAQHMAQHSLAAVAIFSLEMSAHQIAERLLAMQSRVDATRLRSGQLNRAELAQVVEAAHALGQLAIWIDDSSALRLPEIRARARRLHAEQPLALVIVDYLQLLEAGGENRVQEVAAISRGLKALARDLKLPVLALSQLSRASEQRADHRPLLSDLRDSGSLEQDADVVLFLHRPDRYDEAAERGVAEVHVAKHRNGPTGMVSLYFDAPTTRFHNLGRTEGPR